jgi:hypothetical protein
MVEGVNTLSYCRSQFGLTFGYKCKTRVEVADYEGLSPIDI